MRSGILAFKHDDPQRPADALYSPPATLNARRRGRLRSPEVAIEALIERLLA